MARSRVLSFMSTFGGPPRSPTEKQQRHSPPPREPEHRPTPTSMANTSMSNLGRESPMPAVNRQRASSRPMSMIGGYQPPLMQIASDTIPELAPIFTFLNSHSNKLYQEGYFLKLNDLDSHGRPYPDRLWTECFAQLVGTVLSLWDAAALDAAGEEGEVAPTFINLADASIKMIETLPTRSQDTQPLTNVLSISTAGKNRYLFHFSTVNALTQWTAGIRLAMFENASLQEAYTGALIAGKGKTLNNIKMIMERSRFKTEEWTRVRFGAGTPWRRCWCVISPPDEKEAVAQRRTMKKKSAYDRAAPVLRGDIKFYDTRKIKKNTVPIATVRDAYSAYAIYPQSKPLIEQSTLIKIEGVITIHTNPEVTTEGFIFVMPEVRPAISGFEMMLRFLFPIYDTFALYGRPTRLVADTMDTRSLMFAMPQEKRYGYLEIFDIATLIHTAGSQSWNEREWKKQLKQLTSQRIGKMSASRSRQGSRMGSRHSHRNSLPSRGAALRFQDGAHMRSTPSLHRDGDFAAAAPAPPRHSESAPPADAAFPPPRNSTHQRSASESVPATSPRREREPNNYIPSRLSHEQARDMHSSDEDAPPPPAHVVPVVPLHQNHPSQRFDLDGQNDRSSSESEHAFADTPGHGTRVHPARDAMEPHQPPSPVTPPPAFSHEPGAKPQTRPNQAPELRRANSRMSSTTLSQLAAAGNAGTGVPVTGGGLGPSQEGRYSEDLGNRGVNNYFNTASNETTADSGLVNKGLVLEDTERRSSNQGQPRSGRQPSPSQFNFPFNSNGNNTSYPDNDRSHKPTDFHSPSPLSQAIIVSDDITQPVSQTQPPLGEPSSASLPAEPPSGQITPRTEKRMSIARKPLPSPSRSSGPPNPKIDTETGASKFAMDEAAFNRVHTMKSVASSEPNSRRDSGDSSRYDPDSAVTPDYASTQDSVVPPLPTETSYKPRTGVLKTVGDVNPENQDVVIGDAHYRPEPTRPRSAGDDLDIDFGPTKSFAPSAGLSPVRRSSSELLGSNNRMQNRLSLVSPEPGSQSRTEANEKRRSLAWQPGAAVVGSNQTTRQSMTPEQFVQQRAAASRNTAPYAHARQSSATPPLTHGRRDSRTPPLVSRNSSGDWTQQPSPGRPQSAMKNTVPDFSAHLSAREQEHVARVTGSPLINMAGNSAPSVPSGGLIGAIEAREREKEEMKAGVRSSVMVQQAIAQRQQQVQREQKAHQRTQSQQQQYQQQPMPYMHVPGQYPTTPQAYDEGRGNPQQDYMQAHRIMPPQQWPYQPPAGYQQQAQVAQYGATAQAQQQGQYQQHSHLPPQQQQQQGQFQQYPPPQQQQGQFQQYPSPSQQPQGQFSNQYYNSQYGSGSGQQGGR